MEFSNFTPFSANAWETVNHRNKWYATCLVRAKFKLRRRHLAPSANQVYTDENVPCQWECRAHPEQGDLFDEDQFYHEDFDSSIRYESDYVNYKPHTDIIVNANAYASGEEKSSNWSCSVKVYSPDNKALLNQLSLLVQGERRLAIRTKIGSLPIRYEYCKGGVRKINNKGEEDENYEVDLYNPVGCGAHAHKHQDSPQSVQIDYAQESIKNIPPGFGFIHRSWKSRLDYAGTYDDNWLESQHPLPPNDFDFFHNQAAHPALITKSYLRAGSVISLSNLIKGAPHSYFILPDYRFLSRVISNTHKQHQAMNLDTLIIDLDQQDTEELAVYGSWRSYTPLMDSAISAETMLVPNQAKTADQG